MPDRLTETYLKENGTLLGEGAFGVAYRIDEVVYKVLKEGQSTEAAGRAARLWNEFYTSAYDKRFSLLATAKAMRLEDGNVVLITPYVPGETPDHRTYDPRALQTELNRFSRYLIDNNAENVKIIDGFILPIDFDMYCLAPKERRGSVKSEAIWKDAGRSEQRKAARIIRESATLTK